MEVKNRKWDLKKFHKERQEVLNQWPTGKEVDLDEAFKYHGAIPKNRITINKLKEAKQGVTLAQPRPEG